MESTETEQILLTEDETDYVDIESSEPIYLLTEEAENDYMLYSADEEDYVPDDDFRTDSVASDRYDAEYETTLSADTSYTQNTSANSEGLLGSIAGAAMVTSLISLAFGILGMIATFKVVKKLGKSTGFAVLSMFFWPICGTILAFGKDKNAGDGSAVPTETTPKEKKPLFGGSKKQIEPIVPSGEMHGLEATPEMSTPETPTTDAIGTSVDLSAANSTPSVPDAPAPVEPEAPATSEQTPPPVTPTA